jgi:hypothetical protein
MFLYKTSSNILYKAKLSLLLLYFRPLLALEVYTLRRRFLRRAYPVNVEIRYIA